MTHVSKNQISMRQTLGIFSREKSCDFVQNPASVIKIMFEQYTIDNTRSWVKSLKKKKTRKNVPN